MNVIQQIDSEHMAEINAKRSLPEFSPGDTIRVNVRVSEGARTRIQAYEGVCIARSGGGIRESFTVRKISYGEGVERVFPFYSPVIEDVEVIRRGKVRRAKLYYLRDRRGKAARIPEATNVRAKRLNEEQKSVAAKTSKSKAKKSSESDQATNEVEVIENESAEVSTQDQAVPEAVENETTESAANSEAEVSKAEAEVEVAEPEVEDSDAKATEAEAETEKDENKEK